jgi:hypothetical protein
LLSPVRQLIPMAEGNEFIASMVRDPLSAIKVEDLVAEVARDLVKDEIKRRIMQKLDEDPKLRRNVQEAIAELMEAKIRETYAMVKIGKCGLDLGVALVPPELRQKIDRDIASLLERELSSMVSRIE